MALTQQVQRYATRKVMHRLTRSIPWIGGVVALVTLGSAIRRKGFLGGTAHTALDMIPYIGGAKNLVEMGRGRDLIRDRPIMPSRVGQVGRVGRVGRSLKTGAPAAMPSDGL